MTWIFRLLTIGLFVVCGVLLFLALRKPAALLSPIPRGATSLHAKLTPLPTATPARANLFAQKKRALGKEKESLQEDLSSILSQFPDFTVSVEVRDIDRGVLAAIHTDKTYPAASTAKLITAAYALTQIQQGAHSFDESLGLYTYRDQLESLINRSNNDSWDLFNTSFGLSKQQKFAESLGLPTYDVYENTATVSDIAQLLELLARGELLDQDHTLDLYSWMQRTLEERFIPSAIPSALTVYHKHGIFEDNVHDAAIITNGSRYIVLVIYTQQKGSWDYEVRIPIFHALTKTVVETLFPTE